jgi:hypothetical protein
MSYANKTTVPVSKSMAELEATLARYGASAFAYATDSDRNEASVAFKCSGYTIRFVVMIPSAATLQKHAKRKMTPLQAEKAHYDEKRRLWRALCLLVKAKLEAVASGITSFDSEFMSNVVMPNGKTVAQWAYPQIVEALVHGNEPRLLNA